MGNQGIIGNLKRLKWMRIIILLSAIILMHGLIWAKEPAPTMSEIKVHYYRYDGDYAGWTLWTWNALSNTSSKEITAISQDTDGLEFVVRTDGYGAGSQVGLLPKYRNWDDKDSPDRVYKPNLGKEFWIVQGDPVFYTTKPDLRPAIRGAYLDKPNEIRVQLWKNITLAELTTTLIKVQTKTGSAVKVESAELFPLGAKKSRTVLLMLEKPFNLSQDTVLSYRVEMPNYRSTGLTLGEILDTPSYYSDAQLGVHYTAQKSIFRLFAPTASGVTLNLYDVPSSGKAKNYSLKHKQHGVWEITVPGNLKNKYYTYCVKGSDPRFKPNHELIDPYSKSNTAHNGRGMIIDDKTPVADRPNFDISQAVIYEMHIRDLTISPNSGVKNKGKYIGLIEEATRLPGHSEITTALDHILELGVNVVQILPFQDFENDESKNDYNWGYMPVHFNSPDGWYATERQNAKRVEETKKMINAFHKKGIKVIMDVVYNHTAENNPDKLFSFNGIVPGYYYRLKPDGSYWNGSGTGNEFRSEAPMGRKFLLDSLKYWVNEYKVDGFRFDLMGLIDLQTVEQIARELHLIDPNIFVYGEPWAGGDTPTKITSKGTQRSQGFSVFNDNFRNSLKGSVFGIDKGYIQIGNYVDGIKQGVIGSVKDFTDSPLETLNYLECHDNRTLWDRLVYTTKGDKAITEADLIAMDKLGALILFTSQGVPFIEAGQEFLRSKGGDENSYNKPDSVNQIDWSNKLQYHDVYQYYRGLIQLRKAHPMLRFKTKEDVLANVKFLDDDLKLTLPQHVVGYLVSRGNSGDAWKSILVLTNPNPIKVDVPIPAGDWYLAVDADNAYQSQLLNRRPELIEQKISLPGRTGLVLYQK